MRLFFCLKFPNCSLNSDFSESNTAQMKNAYIVDEEFSGKNYPAEGFLKGEYENCTFRKCIFSGVDLSAVIFLACRFEECDLSNAILKNTSLKDIKFKNCKLMGLRFDECSSMLLA